MTANRPQPRPGMLDIAPYVPGKSTAPEPPRCSSCPPTRRRSGRARRRSRPTAPCGEHLEDYPDGSASALREAIGRAFGLDPDRIICGAGSDDLLNLLARAYLSDGDEAIYTTHGFLVYPIATMGDRRQDGCRAGNELHRRCRRDPRSGDAEDQDGLSRQPEQSDRNLLPFDEVKRLHAGLPPHVLLVLDAAYAEYVQRNDYESGIELVATTDNAVMTRTFSKIYGLAALRIGWMYRPGTRRRCGQPHPRTVQRQSAPAIAAGIAAIADTAHVDGARAHNAHWLTWLTEEIGKLGLAGDAERGEFRADPFPGNQRQDRERCRCLPHQARTDPAPGRRLQAAERLAHERRHRRGQSPRRAGAQGILGKTGMSKPEPLFNRLALIGFGLIGCSIARAARAQGAARTIVATARSPKTRRRVAELGIADQVVETNRRRGRRRRPRHRLHSGRRLRHGRQGDRCRI